MQITAKRSSLAADRTAVLSAFLKGVLTKRAIGVSELEVQAKGARLLAGHQSITDCKRFRAAKKRLGIVSYRAGFSRGGEWFWSLPAQPLAEVTETAAEMNAAAPATYGTEHCRSERPASSHPRTQPRPLHTHVESTPRGTIPQGWEIGVEGLHHRQQRAGVPHHPWHLFLDYCARFLDRRAGWAERAAEQGWDAQSLFGCDRSRPLDHPNADPLWRLAGGILLAINKDWAWLRSTGDNRPSIDDPLRRAARCLGGCDSCPAHCDHITPTQL
jgi:hypothetical protein